MRRIKSDIEIFEVWRPGKHPTEFRATFKPLWAWPVKERRNLWLRRRHPKKYRRGTLWVQVGVPL